MSYHNRPKFADDVKSVSARTLSEKELAIVLQGPFDKNDDFTLETIKLYNNIFNGALIILSTWKDESSDLLTKAKQLGVEVVLNDKPESFGPFNVNLQLTCTASGIRHAEKLGFEYVIKARTDQRMYRYDSFDFLKSMQKAFPLKQQGLLSERLVTWSFGTCKYRLYGVTDFFMFGKAQDMIKYWTPDFYEQGIESYKSLSPDVYPPLIENMPIVAEIYIFVKFLEKVDAPVKWTFEQYWKVLRDYFCVVDGHALDVYWDKYFKMEEHRYVRDYSNTNHRAMEFSDWLQLYVEENPSKWEGVRTPEAWHVVEETTQIRNL